MRKTDEGEKMRKGERVSRSGKEVRKRRIGKGEGGRQGKGLKKREALCCARILQE